MCVFGIINLVELYGIKLMKGITLIGAGICKAQINSFVY